MIEKIEAIVCNGENLSPVEIHVKSRKKEKVQARQMVMWFAKNETTLSLENIGNYYGYRHCNVLAAIKEVNKHIDTELSYKEKIDNYQKQIERYKDTFKRIDLLTLLLSDVRSKINECDSTLERLRIMYEKISEDILLLEIKQ